MWRSQWNSREHKELPIPNIGLKLSVLAGYDANLARVWPLQPIHNAFSTYDTYNLIPEYKLEGIQAIASGKLCGITWGMDAVDDTVEASEVDIEARRGHEGGKVEQGRGHRESHLSSHVEGLEIRVQSDSGCVSDMDGANNESTVRTITT